MDEDVLFNPGDAISSSRDFTEAQRSADIYNARQGRKRGILIAQPLDGKDFSVFYADDLIPWDDAPADIGGEGQPQKYHVKQKLDKKSES